MKIQVGDLICIGGYKRSVGIGRVKKFMRSGNWCILKFGTFTDVFNTKHIYGHLRDGTYTLYKKVDFSLGG